MKRKYSEIKDDSNKKIINLLNKHLDIYCSNAWLFIGISGSGKSYLANKFIIEYPCDERYYFSPTPEPIKFWVTKHYNHEELQIDVIKNLIIKQKQYTIFIPRIQIIINDYSSCFKEKEIKKTLEHLSMCGRHYKIDLIILTQYYTSIPPSVRTNIQNNIYFGTTNKNELNNINRLSYETPIKSLGYFISKLNKYEYILQIPSKITGKPIFTKLKDLDIIENISEFD